MLAVIPVVLLTTILATELWAQPAFMTRVVVRSTRAGILSLTVLKTWRGSQAALSLRVST